MIVIYLFLRQVPGLRRYTNSQDCVITFPDLEFLLQKYSAANPRWELASNHRIYSAAVKIAKTFLWAKIKRNRLGQMMLTVLDLLGYVQSFWQHSTWLWQRRNAGVSESACAWFIQFRTNMPQYYIVMLQCYIIRSFFACALDLAKTELIRYHTKWKNNIAWP